MSLLEENMLDQNYPNNLMDDFGLHEISSDKQFDDILKLACFVADCEAAYISIIDHKRQNIRYTKNFPSGEYPLDHSVCKLVLEQRELVQIADINNYPALHDSVLASQQNFAFYAGLPIINEHNNVLATLCVLHTEAKALTALQIANFEILGDQVLNILALRKQDIQKKKDDQSADENRVFFDASSSVICILSDSLVIKSINKASFAIFGFTPEELKGLNIADFILREDRIRVLELASHKLKNNIKNFEIQTRIRAKNNSIKWISWNAVTKNRKWFIIGREITAEKEISKNLNQLSTVASKINSGIAIGNAKSEVVWLNQAFTDITGYNLNDVQSKRLGDMLAGNGTNKALIAQERQEIENKKSSSIELLAYRKDGEKIWLSIHNTIILDDSGEIDSQIGIYIDITARKESEKQLKLLSLVASKTNNGVHICDSEGNVTWINEALENILGYSKETLVGKKLVDFVKGKDTDLELVEIVREKARKFEPFNIEHKVYRKDGSEIWISIANTPIYNEAINQHTQIEIINDITRRKQAEFQMIASREETLQLSKAKESFLSIMSHEIRTPLNAIIGLADILYSEEKLPAQEQSINLLKFSADNLLSLINDILDFSKIEVGKMTLENKRLDIRVLLMNIVDSMRFKIDGKPIELSYDVNSQVPELVRGDKTRLYQVLSNLINNSIKFTEKGVVKILVERSPDTRDKVTLNFRIIDTGIGIPEDKISTIFEPFTQAESNTARKYGGSGLGLSITKKLINLFDGKIVVKSELGVGTEFSFDLKFNKFEGPLEMPEKKQDIQIDAKILVVDDNEINTLLAKRVLSRFGLTVVTTSNGREAIELLQSKDFDLVLMDVHMPDLDGYETTTILRAMDDAYFKNLPIIALTASVLDDGLDGIEKCGMTDFQLKPFNAEELANKIEKYVRKS